MKKEIPIFFAVDDEYIPFLGVTLKSIIDNSSEKYLYTIRILYTKISNDNILRIKKLERENLSIEFIDLNYYIDSIKEKLYTRDYYSKATYFRLFLPKLYPDYDKVIYLDSDTILNANIAELYEIDIGDKLIGAIPDEIVGFTPIFREYVERVIGCQSYKNYFNAGVLVMNLKEMREFKFQEKFLYLLEKTTYSVAQDQDYLNRICKGRVHYIDTVWNKMPVGRKSIESKDIKLVHYNFAHKPWHYETVMYEDYFWKYANETEFIEEIREEQKTYTDEQKKEDNKKMNQLLELAQLEIDCIGDDRKKTSRLKKINQYLQEYRKSNDLIRQSEDRLSILEEISKLEKEGNFYVDPEKDPPTIPLMPGEVDYLKEKMTSKLKTTVANSLGLGFLMELLRKNQLIIKEINGIENINNLNTGAIFTCNHFNPFDVFAVETAMFSSTQKRKKLYKVIREGNYTNFPGFYGYLFRNSNTLPLSSNTKTMTEFVKAVDKILAENDYILIYPEQSLWWNYKKPKNLKIGAYKMAAKNKVPIVPIFITMKNSDIIGNDGFPINEYHIHIGKPIYPNIDLSIKENSEIMKRKNFECWKNIYETFYNKPLEYTTIEGLSPLKQLENTNVEKSSIL